MLFSNLPITRTFCFVLAGLFGETASGGVRVNIVEDACFVTAEDRQEIQEMINVQWIYFNTLFDYDEVVDLRILIFGNRDEYYRYYDTHTVASPTVNRSPGYYSPSRKEVVLYKQEGFRSTIYHEASHFLYGLKTRQPHKWLNEGMAKYFQQARMERGLFIVDEGNPSIQRKWEQISVWLLNGRMIPLSQFVSLNATQWAEYMDRNEGDYCYTTAWSVVHYLAQSDKGVKILEAMLKESLSEKDPVKVIDHNYRGGAGRLDTDWRRYVQAMAELHR